MSLNPVISKTWDTLAGLACQVKIPDKTGKMIPLTSEGELKDIKALSGYAEREGFFGTLATIAHRVWNAVKAIFGQSDWQRGERALISLSQRVAPLVKGSELTKEEIENGKKKLPEILPFIDQANKFFKPHEATLLPIVTALTTSLNIQKIAKEGIEVATENLKTAFERRKADIIRNGGQPPAEDDEVGTINLMIDAAADCGYINHAGVTSIKKIFPFISQYFTNN